MLKGYIARRIRYGGPAYDQGLALGILGLIALPVLGLAMFMTSWVKNYWVFYLLIASIVYGQAFLYNYLYSLGYVHGFFLASAIISVVFLPAYVMMKLGFFLENDNEELGWLKLLSIPFLFVVSIALIVPLTHL